VRQALSSSASSIMCGPAYQIRLGLRGERGGEQRANGSELFGFLGPNLHAGLMTCSDA
jgi:hypothetical protein